MKTANDGMHSALYWPARVAELEKALREVAETLESYMVPDTAIGAVISGVCLRARALLKEKP